MDGLITDIIFVAASFIAILFSLLVVLFRNPVYCAFFLINMFFALAVIFVLCYAPFLAIIQILVYGGAIMVLYSFVIMMINLQKNEYIMEKTFFFRLSTGVITFIFLIMVVFMAGGTGLLQVKETQLPETPYMNPSPGMTVDPRIEASIEDFGSASSIGSLIFQENLSDNIYLLTFELVSLLIIAAVVGAVVLTKRIRKTEL